MIKTNFKSPFSWYHCLSEGTILIGPEGYGNDDYIELEFVATPAKRWVNPFYMEAECACVMERHHLITVYERKEVRPHCIYYGKISFQVPDIETDMEFDYDFIRAYHTFRDNWIKQHHGKR
jgi:hypothetical protein